MRCIIIDAGQLKVREQDVQQVDIGRFMGAVIGYTPVVAGANAHGDHLTIQNQQVIESAHGFSLPTFGIDEAVGNGVVTQIDGGLLASAKTSLEEIAASVRWVTFVKEEQPELASDIVETSGFAAGLLIGSEPGPAADPPEVRYERPEPVYSSSC